MSHSPGSSRTSATVGAIRAHSASSRQANIFARCSSSEVNMQPFCHHRRVCSFLGGIHFQFLQAVAAGGRTRVRSQTNAVEDRAQAQQGDKQKGYVEITQLRQSRRVTVRMGHKAKSDR